MRKLVLVLATIFALCLFTALAVAQTPGGTTGVNANSSQNSSNSSSPADSSAAVSGSQTDPNSVNAASGEKTVDGCVVKEQSDYFIQPKDGDRERLAGTQDFSSHVGHEVKVHGTEQAAAAASTGAVSGSDRTSTSGSAKTESQNNAAGSMAGNAGSSNASGTSGFASNNERSFTVTKVEMVSASCPADIQKKIDAGKK